MTSTKSLEQAVERATKAVETEFFHIRELGTDRGIITPERLTNAALAAFFTAREPDAAEVEAVAQAVRIAYCGEGAAETWKRLEEKHKQIWRNQARAAIAASDAWRAKMLGEKA